MTFKIQFLLNLKPYARDRAENGVVENLHQQGGDQGRKGNGDAADRLIADAAGKPHQEAYECQHGGKDVQNDIDNGVDGHCGSSYKKDKNIITYKRDFVNRFKKLSLPNLAERLAIGGKMC